MMKKRQTSLEATEVFERLREVWRVALMTVVLTMPVTLEATQLSGSDTVPLSDEEVQTILTLSPLNPSQAVDPTNRYDGQTAAIDFGKKLFFETRLSRNGRHSCGTCHQPERGWADGKQLATLDGTMGRHTPSLWNVRFNRWFNWDGRADSLWSQALGPIESPAEMANDRVSIVRLLMHDETLRREYEGVFGEFSAVLDPAMLPSSALPGPRHSENPLHQAWAQLTPSQQTEINRVFTNLGKAIAAFEATIISSDSAFDRFADGLRTGERDKLTVLSKSAKRGLKLFVGEAMCVVCHSGPTFSDLEFHNVLLPSIEQASDGDKGRYSGIPELKKLSFNSKSPYNDAAPGDYADWVTYVRRTVENRRQFKTPTLRNVTKTAPYMHTGQFGTLTESVEHCSSMDESLGEEEHSEVILSHIELTKGDIQDLVAFLVSLTDESYLDTFKRP